MGDELHSYDNGWSRSVIRMRLGAFDIELLQARDVITGTRWADLRGRGIATTQIIATPREPMPLEELEVLRGALMHTLSVATSSLVWASHWQVDDGERMTTSAPATGFINHFRPCIDTLDGAAVKRFVESCFAGYLRTWRTRDFSVVAAYYAHSQFDGDPIELALIKSFVCMEHLKHTFATEAGYPYLKGYWRGRGATAKNPGKAKGLRELVEEMCAAVGMTPSLQPLVDIRNEVIHSGLSVLPHDRQWQLYEAAQDTVREYVLRLLGYRGEYLTFSAPRMVARI